MALIMRCQAVIPFGSGLPEDVITNTLYFQDLSVNQDVQVFADLVHPHVSTFFGSIYDGSMPSYIAPSATWEARYYTVGPPPPNYPVVKPLITTVGPAQFTPTVVPTEVACVLSFHGDQIAGVAAASRRGRIYFGGLHDSAIVASTLSPAYQPPMLSAAWINNVRLAAIDLANAPIRWVVWSPTTQQTSQVTGGWIDNSPDTQRRRGIEATVRTVASNA